MAATEDVLLKPSDLAREAHVLTSKIAYYASLGLLRPGEYTEGGQKLYYRNETITQLKRIDKLTHRGLELESIRQRIGKEKNFKRILVIDDEPTVGEVIQDLLRDQIHGDIQIVLDGFAAGQKLQEYFPDMIILDLNLPGVNGFDVCRLIRQDELQNGVKILAITGYDSEENFRKIIEHGADDFMPKPFETEDMLHKILGMLKLKRKKPAVEGTI